MYIVLRFDDEPVERFYNQLACMSKGSNLENGEQTEYRIVQFDVVQEAFRRLNKTTQKHFRHIFLHFSVAEVFLASKLVRQRFPVAPP